MQFKYAKKSEEPSLTDKMLMGASRGAAVGGITGGLYGGPAGYLRAKDNKYGPSPKDAGRAGLAYGASRGAMAGAGIGAAYEGIKHHRALRKAASAKKIRFSDVVSTPVIPRNAEENRIGALKPVKHGLYGAAIGAVTGGVAGQAYSGDPFHALVGGVHGAAMGFAGGALHGAYKANKRILQNRADRGEELVSKQELRDFHNRPVQHHYHG